MFCHTSSQLRVVTFARFGGDFWTNRHARARAIHQGTKVRLPLPPPCPRRKALNFLAHPLPDSVMLTRLRFAPFLTLLFSTCFRTSV